MIERIPGRFGGLSFTTILKVNLSWFTFHWTPSARSVKTSPKSRVLTQVALSFSGMDFNTSLSLESPLVSRKPPLARRSRISLASFTASSVVATDFKQSAT